MGQMDPMGHIGQMGQIGQTLTKQNKPIDKTKPK